MSFKAGLTTPNICCQQQIFQLYRLQKCAVIKVLLILWGSCKVSCKTWKIPLSKKLEFSRASAIFDKGIKLWKMRVQRNWIKQLKKSFNRWLYKGFSKIKRLLYFYNKGKVFEYAHLFDFISKSDKSRKIFSILLVWEEI